jgi:hypothetical protein
VHNGKLDLHGVLDGTVTSWKEQLILVLKDSAQDNIAAYHSPVCTSADCVYTVDVTPPSNGQWTVLPEWTRYAGNFQSAGAEPGFVSF